MTTKKNTVKIVATWLLLLLVSIVILTGCNDGESGSPAETTVPAHVHTFGEWIETEPAICNSNGKRVRSCACGESEVEILEMTGHTEVIDAAVEATCIKKGLTEGKHCSVCDDVIIAQLEVEPKGHTDGEWITDKEATRSEDGSRSLLCAVCGETVKTEILKATGSIGLAYTVNDDGVSCTVIGVGSCTDKDIIISYIINGYTVTAIGDKAFASHTEITSIKLPNTITTIGTRAFYECTGLTEFTVPASVTEIGNQAFYKANNITTVYYNSSYGMSDNPILNLPSLKKVVFNGNGVPAYICKDCPNLSEVEFGENVEFILFGAFENCKQITSIVIPSNVTFVNGAFTNCTSLTTVSIADGVSYIGSAFDNCTSLVSVAIPDSVTSIEVAFRGCTSLTSVTIPDSVTCIGNDAFEGCTLLTSVTIPDSVTSIESSAFSGCTSLTSVTIPDSVTSIESSAFNGCTSLASVAIPNSITSIEHSAFKRCTSLTSVTIPDSVTSIGDSAFYGCTSLTSVTIPDSVTSIGNSAFDDCTSLTSIKFGGTKAEWEKIEKSSFWIDSWTSYVIYCTDFVIQK